MLLVLFYSSWLVSSVVLYFGMPLFYYNPPFFDKCYRSVIGGWAVGLIITIIIWIWTGRNSNIGWDSESENGKALHIGDIILANHHSKTAVKGALHDVAGGKITFEKDRLVFRPHSLNIDRAIITILYKDIDRCEPGPLNNVIVKQKNGDSDMFVTYHKNRVISFINSLAGE